VSEAEFGQLFGRFKAMLAPYTKDMYVSADTSQWFGVDMAPEAERNPTTWFGATRVGKRYVSYYLMPIYVKPDLLDDVSPELRKRMQGKSCFNFAKVDEQLLAELEDLTRRGYAATAGDPGWGIERRRDRGMRVRG
jgi:hypothetical protein